MKKLVLNSDLRSQMMAEALRCYPNEACGFLIGKTGETREAVEFIPCRNLQDDWHAADPIRYPRTAETAYGVDSKEQEKIFQQAKEQNLTVIAIVHSHPNHDAYFSAEDKQGACPWGEPLFENVSYVVVSVYGEKIKEIFDYVWDDSARDFVKQDVL
jgi:proteasome lid subunit RPN8/RPN11